MYYSYTTQGALVEGHRRSNVIGAPRKLLKNQSRLDICLGGLNPPLNTTANADITRGFMNEIISKNDNNINIMG